ncbi:MAG: hypothetical protein J6J19_00805 [Oscillospiraceae bacterium]|nr:hypothetical protein [Oscillospiraceae bacterium]
MGKKYRSFILLLLSLALLLCGCDGRERETDAGSLCEVTLERGKVYVDEDGLERLSYEISVFNKSDTSLKDVTITISLRDEMENYLAAGITEMQYSFDLFETEERAAIDKIGRGAIITWSPMIMDGPGMDSVGINFEDIFNHGKEVCVEITWDGGKETHALVTEIENLL